MGLRLRGGVLAMAAGIGLLTGCGSRPAGSGGEAARGPHSIRPWIAAEPTNDPTELHLVYWGPDAEADKRCTARNEVETQVAHDGVLEATIYVYAIKGARAWTDCPWSKQRIALHLDHPLGGDPLREYPDGRTVRATASGGYELVAETTPCGRVDCSTPSPHPAPCEGDAVLQAFASEVDGGIRTVGEPKCDGSFLVVDMDVGSAG